MGGKQVSDRRKIKKAFRLMLASFAAWIAFTLLGVASIVALVFSVFVWRTFQAVASSAVAFAASLILRRVFGELTKNIEKIHDELIDGKE